MTWIGIADLTLLVGQVVAAVLQTWPKDLRVLVNTGIMVALLINWVMPLLTRRFQGWLVQA